MKFCVIAVRAGAWLPQAERIFISAFKDLEETQAVLIHCDNAFSAQSNSMR